MNILKDAELTDISAGGVGAAIVVGIGTAIVFIIGIINGYINPDACNIIVED